MAQAFPTPAQTSPLLTTEADSLSSRLQGILDDVRSVSYRVHGTQQADRESGNPAAVAPVSPISDSVALAHKVIGDISSELSNILGKL